MSAKVPITIAHGDGIGPEIMAATLKILDAAGAALVYETIEIGEKVYLAGHKTGITDEAWESLRRTKVFLKAPITTPQGGGFNSLNVTIRKTLGLYANVRPCVSYFPYVDTRHEKMDVVIVRENEEDLYAGIEHRQTDDVYQCLKIITRPGSEKIIRYAFEYAKANGRKKVSCFSKDNIMKLTDGLFHKVFDEVGAEYPDIEKDHWIIDIGSARLADTPEIFDVIVTSNLYGDIISDIAAQITGSVGLGGSSNIGLSCAMFEAIHGSAPPIAGQGIANPSGLLLGAVMMLVHIGQPDVAEKIHNAWLRTLEDGVHTGDIYKEGLSTKKVGTNEFADELIKRLGQRPEKLTAAEYDKERNYCTPLPRVKRVVSKKETVGLDLFVHWSEPKADELARRVKLSETENLKLTMITNRGVVVWPEGFSETFCVDSYRCRIFSTKPVELGEIVQFMSNCEKNDVPFVKTEHLCTFDGVPGFSSGQGE